MKHRLLNVLVLFFFFFFSLGYISHVTFWHGQHARNQFSQNDNSVSKDDHSILTSARKREADQPLKVITTSAKRKPNLISNTHAARSYSLEPFSLLNGTYNDRKWIENVSWASLPASLMNLGKVNYFYHCHIL